MGTAQSLIPPPRALSTHSCKENPRTRLLRYKNKACVWGASHPQLLPHNITHARLCLVDCTIRLYAVQPRHLHSRVHICTCLQERFILKSILPIAACIHALHSQFQGYIQPKCHIRHRGEFLVPLAYLFHIGAARALVRHHRQIVAIQQHPCSGFQCRLYQIPHMLSAVLQQTSNLFIYAQALTGKRRLPHLHPPLAARGLKIRYHFYAPSSQILS